MAYTVHLGDALAVLRTLAPESVNCCVTSPPYWGLRDYGVAGQMGLEESPQAYVDGMVAVFAEVRRVLRDTGERMETTTRSTAWVANERTPVVMLTGISGYYHLSRVTIGHALPVVSETERPT